jgi:NADP-dependent 3-hydroxy acid dehydrogenase YdfG
LAIARGLGSAGSHVVLNGRNRDKLARAAEALAAEGIVAAEAPFDVTDAAPSRPASRASRKAWARSTFSSTMPR